MKIKTLKELIKDLDDDVEVTIIEFDYDRGTVERYANVAVTQMDNRKFRLTPGMFDWTDVKKGDN